LFGTDRSNSHSYYWVTWHLCMVPQPMYEGSFSRWRHGRINYFYFKCCFIEFMAKDTVCHVCIFDRLCELLSLPPFLWLVLSPFPVWISKQHTVLTIYVPEALLRCPLLCWCIPFRIFERCLELNPVNCRSKQARNQLSHPSPWGFWFLIKRKFVHWRQKIRQ